MSAGVETRHGEDAARPIGELHRHDLMIDDIVVGVVDTSPVRAVRKGAIEFLPSGDVNDRLEGPAGVACVEEATIERGRRVRTGALEGTVHASWRRPRRRCFGTEVLQSAEARDRRDRLAHDVLKPVDVV